MKKQKYFVGEGLCVNLNIRKLAAARRKKPSHSSYITISLRNGEERGFITAEFKADNALLRELKAEIKKLAALVARTVSAIAEELKELRSEKALILQRFEYAEDAGAEAFRKDIATMEAGLKSWRHRNKKLCRAERSRRHPKSSERAR